MIKNSSEKKKQISFELEDQKWFPEFLRAYQTDLLGIIAKSLELYSPAKSFLKDKLRKGQTVADLASGSGVPTFLATNGMEISVKLSDKFPEGKQVEFMSKHDRIAYNPESVDVLRDDLPEGDCYTMFNGLHHFTPTEIALILRKAKSRNTPIYFFEPISPSLLVYLKVALATLILPIFLVPFIKPFRWDRLIFTYLIPIGILATFWDGMISVGKSYSISEIRRMEASIAPKEIFVSYGKLKGKFANLTYLGLEL